HLPDQCVHVRKLQFFANETDESHIESLAVQIALEVEQEDFQERRAIVESRAAAEARDTFEALSSVADPHRIDAVLEPAIAVEPRVGGVLAEPAAALLAVDRLAGHEPRAAEHGGGVLDLALRERRADGAGGHRPLVDVDMRLHVDLDAEPGPFRHQKA